MLEINIPALFLTPTFAMAKFLPNPDESSVEIYVPGPPSFILDSQTTFQLIWTDYLIYSPQESMDAFFFVLLILHRS